MCLLGLLLGVFLISPLLTDLQLACRLPIAEPFLAYLKSSLAFPDYFYLRLEAGVGGEEVFLDLFSHIASFLSSSCDLRYFLLAYGASLTPGQQFT